MGTRSPFTQQESSQYGVASKQLPQDSPRALAAGARRLGRAFPATAAAAIVTALLVGAVGNAFALIVYTRHSGRARPTTAAAGIVAALLTLAVGGTHALA